MATNFYFNNFPAKLGDAAVITPEQILVENLVIEALQIYGMDVYYLPRTTRDEVDYLFGEDPLKEYRSAHAVEMYLENVTGMDGEQDFISKFGLEIKDEVMMLVSRLKFRYAVNGLTRPREGDLVYIPLLTGFFEITYVEHENNQAMYYTLGRGRGGNFYVYALKMKQFVFSNEIIDVGVPEIDGQIRGYYMKTRLSLGSGYGNFVNDELVYQGDSVANSTAQAFVYEFKPNAYVDVYRMQGDFSSSANVIGETSGAQWTITLASDAAIMNTPYEDIFDNQRIQRASDGIIDFTEINPFGEP